MSKSICTDFYPNYKIKRSRKSKFQIFVYSIKNNLLTIIFSLFCIGLITFSKSNLAAAKNGLTLWATAVIPSLFPFFVSTELLASTNIVKHLGKFLNPIMRPLFNVPGEGAFAFLMGLISGYPVGAKIVSSFMEEGICTKDEAERMLAFTNNSGPLFIIGTVGISLFGSTAIGILLFITHILSCITVGIVLHFISSRRKLHKIYSRNIQIKSKSNNASLSSLGEILGKSITNSISTILMIGGFVVVFSVLISILNQSHLLDIISKFLNSLLSIFNFPLELTKPILSGIIELTNGLNLVATTHIKSISINIILSAFLLGFGGLSILLQVFSIVSKSGLSIKTYTFGKLLQGLLAALYTYIALELIPFLQFNL